MREKIPEDVVWTAHRIASLVDHTERERAAAKAILAERERCARVIQPFTKQGGQGGVQVRSAAWSMLDAVREVGQGGNEEAR